MESKALSVTQLNEYIKGVFEDELILHSLCIYGEVSEAYNSHNNIFVTLKEGQSSINCVRFGSNENIPVGSNVTLFGGMNVSTKSGKLSFVFNSCQIKGKGAQHEALLKLKKQFADEGLFENKRVLPSIMRDIVIVTSQTGAVLHDLISTIHRYYDFGKISIFSVKVQGAYAATEIATAIKTINNCKNRRFDVIILARGGGSEDDLSPFNTEIVARAVALSDIPLISAIGHETDYTLTDLCASMRAGTPSIAGEIVANANALQLDKLYRAIKLLPIKATSFFNNKNDRLRSYAKIIMANSRLKIRYSSQKIFLSAQSLSVSLYRWIDSKRNSVISNVRLIKQGADKLILINENMLTKHSGNLEKHSPLRILSSGYAKIFKNGKPIKVVQQLSCNDEIKICFSDGSILAEVKSKL